MLNAPEEFWLRFNLLLNKVDFDTLFENQTATEMTNIFLKKVDELVSLVFDKKKDFSENQEIKPKSNNKIP